MSLQNQLNKIKQAIQKWVQDLVFGDLLEKYVEKLKKLRETLSEKTVEIGNLTEQIKELKKEASSLLSQINGLKEQLFKFEKLEELKVQEEKWNDNHSLAVLTYRGRTFPGTNKYMDIPLQLFVTPNDPLIKGDIKSNKLEVEDKANCDDVIFKIYQFTRNNPNNPYRYAYDSATVGVPEYWMFPFELRYAKKGDCDDWGSELASYLIASGVPSFRVRCVCGNCRGYDGIGHFTVYVLGDDMSTWYHLNSTTPPSMLTAKKLSELPTSKDESDLIGIKNVWFSFNDQLSWSDFEGTKTDASNLKKIGIEINGKH